MITITIYVKIITVWFFILTPTCKSFAGTSVWMISSYKIFSKSLWDKELVVFLVTYLQTLLRAWKRFVFVDQWRICEHFSLSHSFVLHWKPYNTFRGRWISSWLLDCFLIHQIKLSIHSVLSHFTSFLRGKHDGWTDVKLSELNWVYWTLSGRTMDRYKSRMWSFAAPKTTFVWCLTPQTSLILKNCEYKWRRDVSNKLGLC